VRLADLAGKEKHPVNLPYGPVCQGAITKIRFAWNRDAAGIELDRLRPKGLMNL
jgi:hypothetical protein